MITYRKITQNELDINYFVSFKHNQRWSRQWIKQDNVWMLKQIEGSRSWPFEKRAWISEYLKEQIQNGGFAIGAFQDDKIIAFVCVSGKIMDDYANLTMLFVDDDFKRLGIGRKLFEIAKKEALRSGAKKLFISAISSEETILFYFAVGCKDAEKVIFDFVDTDKDRYLEISL